MDAAEPIARAPHPLLRDFMKCREVFHAPRGQPRAAVIAVEVGPSIPDVRAFAGLRLDVD
jgi:hypothetical protein